MPVTDRDKKKAPKKPGQPRRKVFVQNDFIEHSHYGNTSRHRAYQQKNSRLVKTTEVPKSFEQFENQSQPNNTEEIEERSPICTQDYCEINPRAHVHDQPQIATNVVPNVEINSDPEMDNLEERPKTDPAEGRLLCQPCLKSKLEVELAELYDTENAYLIGLIELESQEANSVVDYNKQMDRKGSIAEAEENVLQQGAEYATDLGVLNVNLLSVNPMEVRKSFIESSKHRIRRAKEALIAAKTNALQGQDSSPQIENQSPVVESSSNVAAPSKPFILKSILKKPRRPKGFRVNPLLEDFGRAVTAVMARLRIAQGPDLLISPTPIAGTKHTRVDFRKCYQRHDSDVYARLRQEYPIPKSLDDAYLRDYVLGPRETAVVEEDEKTSKENVAESDMKDPNQGVSPPGQLSKTADQEENLHSESGRVDESDMTGHGTPSNTHLDEPAGQREMLKSVDDTDLTDYDSHDVSSALATVSEGTDYYYLTSPGQLNQAKQEVLSLNQHDSANSEAHNKKPKENIGFQTIYNANFEPNDVKMSESMLDIDAEMERESTPNIKRQKYWAKRQPPPPSSSSYENLSGSDSRDTWNDTPVRKFSRRSLFKHPEFRRSRTLLSRRVTSKMVTELSSTENIDLKGSGSHLMKSSLSTSSLDDNKEYTPETEPGGRKFVVKTGKDGKPVLGMERGMRLPVQPCGKIPNFMKPCKHRHVKDIKDLKSSRIPKLVRGKDLPNALRLGRFGKKKQTSSEEEPNAKPRKSFVIRKDGSIMIIDEPLKLDKKKRLPEDEEGK